MPNLEGQRLKGRYQIEALIGRGGMAEVYRALDTRRGYHVAIKVMREDLAEDIEFLRRFRREASALAALSHANIVRFYSFEREGRLAFIVMDYVEGTTLRGRILDAEEDALSLGEVASVMRQTCAALHYAHGENVLHRDVKPGNIMIRPDGAVLVADFGIAKAADAATATTVMPGTPAYMSPEQCRSELLDERADVYSLGIVAYEMLAGRRPFAGNTEEATGGTREKLRWEQIHAPPPPMRESNPDLPAEVEEVVFKALAKEREDRWPTPLAFWQALAKALAVAGVETSQQTPPLVLPGSMPVTPVSTPTPGSLSPPLGAVVEQSATGAAAAAGAQPAAGRLPKGWLFTGVAAVVVIALVLILALGGGRGVSVPYLVGRTLDAAQAMLEGAGLEPVAPGAGGFSPAELLVRGQDPPAGEELSRGSVVYLDVATATPTPTASAGNPTPTPTPGTPPPTPSGTITTTPTETATQTPTSDLTGTITVTLTPAETPTGTSTPTPTQTATETPNSDLTGTITVTPTPTETPTGTSTPTPTPTATTSPTPTPTHTPTIPPPQPAAERIVFTSNRDGDFDVYAMNPDGTNLTQLTANSAFEGSPVWSPDGRRIAFVSDRDGNKEIYVMSADGSGVRRLTNHGAADSYPGWSPDGSRLVFVSERDGNPEIYMMNADGSGQRNLTNHPQTDNQPSWAPVAGRILFRSNRDGDGEIYAMNADGGGVQQLTNNSKGDFTPRWSPDGGRIAFMSNRDGNREIYVMNGDGGGQRRLTTWADHDYEPSWSPDGRRIAFTSNRAGNLEVYTMNADGSDVFRLTDHAGEDSSAHWSPR